jgi:trk system potassium uptake protein TrkH
MPTGTPSRPRWKLRPAQPIVLSFLGAIAVGTALLLLPASQAPGQQISVIDALFTATSAICVTGLSVVEISATFSLFGQVVLMLLIKMGGLGVLTVGLLLTLATRRRIGFRERLQMQAQAQALQVAGVVRLLRNLIIFTVSVELLGALLLFIRFHDYPDAAAPGWFLSLFHSIAAFNNAGFSLFTGNLARFVADPLVSLTIASLVIIGGLGSVVVFEILRNVRTRKPAFWSLHSRIVLSATAVLLLGGMLVFLLLESTNPATLGPLLPGQKLLAAFFQSATTRTAGFETLQFSMMHPGTLILTMLLMLIGASPGSTGGGLKTTTFAVLVASIRQFSLGRRDLVLYGRRILPATVVKAAVVAMLALLAIGLAVTALTFTDSELPVFPLAFEAVSALSTAGLSLGITPLLSPAGRLLVSTLMFMGRVGLFTFTLALVQAGPEPLLRYPPEEVIIG